MMMPKGPPENAEPEDADPEDADPEDPEPEDAEPECPVPEEVDPVDVAPEDPDPDAAEPEDAEPEDDPEVGIVTVPQGWQPGTVSPPPQPAAPRMAPAPVVAATMRSRSLGGCGGVFR